MHVQPSLPGISIHGQHWLPVGSKLGMGGVGATVLKGKHLGTWGQKGQPTETM